jgi:hypothetical protein
VHLALWVGLDLSFHWSIKWTLWFVPLYVVKVVDFIPVLWAFLSLFIAFGSLKCRCLNDVTEREVVEIYMSLSCIYSEFMGNIWWCVNPCIYDLDIDADSLHFVNLCIHLCINFVFWKISTTVSHSHHLLYSLLHAYIAVIPEHYLSHRLCQSKQGKIKLCLEFS